MYKPQLKISLRHLRYLSVINRRKTLSAAAIDLGVTQPALSLAVKEIEQQLGTKLFEKRGREKLLTAAGILAVQFADRTLHEAKELAESLRDENQLVRGTLSVGMIDAASLYLLPAAISAFRKVAPDVEIQIVQNILAAANGAARQAAGNDLGQRGYVGNDPVMGLRPAGRDPKAGDYLIEDQKDAIPPRHLLKLAQG